MSLAGDFLGSALSLKGPQRPSRWTHHALATLAMVGLTVAAGAFLAKLPPECDPETFFPVWPCQLPFLMIAGAIFGLIFLPIALFGLLALRGTGFGGWAPATALGVLLALVGGQAFFQGNGSSGQLAITGATMGFSYWSALFLMCRRGAAS